jgi:hypothetical protein
VQADQLQVGMLWQVAWSVAALQGPAQTPLDQLHCPDAAQAAWVVAIGQSWPMTGFTMHPGVGAQPGICWHSDARGP